MNGVEPSHATIASGQYPGARSMFVYVKKPHLDAIPGLHQFLAHWVALSTTEGPLTSIGLIPSSGDAATAAKTAVTEYPSLTKADFE